MAHNMIEFICPKCNKHITWALAGAVVICTTCGRKVNIKTMKNKNCATLPQDSDQLELFADYE